MCAAHLPGNATKDKQQAGVDPQADVRRLQLAHPLVGCAANAGDCRVVEGERHTQPLQAHAPVSTYD